MQENKTKTENGQMTSQRDGGLEKWKMQEYKRLWINVEAEMEKDQEDGIRGTAPQHRKWEHLPEFG